MHPNIRELYSMATDISFYLEEDEDKESLLEAVKNELEDTKHRADIG